MKNDTRNVSEIREMSDSFVSFYEKFHVFIAQIAIRLAAACTLTAATNQTTRPQVEKTKESLFFHFTSCFWTETVSWGRKPGTVCCVVLT